MSSTTRSIVLAAACALTGACGGGGVRIPPREVQSLDANKPGAHLVWSTESEAHEVEPSFRLEITTTGHPGTTALAGPIVAKLDGSRLVIGECGWIAGNGRTVCAPRYAPKQIELASITEVRLHGSKPRGDSSRHPAAKGLGITIIVLAVGAAIVGLMAHEHRPTGADGLHPP